MINFEAELVKLLAQESKPLPQSEFTELAAIGQQLLLTLNKKQADIAIQIEELYDLTKESDSTDLLDIMKNEKARAAMTVQTAMELSDLIDDFCEFTNLSGSEDLSHQAFLMRKKADSFLEKCGISRIGEQGQPLAPEIHSVQSGAASRVPREHVAKVLQSGYRYLGTLVRKATVVVSTGIDITIEQNEEEKRNHEQAARSEGKDPEQVIISTGSDLESAENSENKNQEQILNSEINYMEAAANLESKKPGRDISSDGGRLDWGVSPENGKFDWGSNSENRRLGWDVYYENRKLGREINMESRKLTRGASPGSERSGRVASSGSGKPDRVASFGSGRPDRVASSGNGRSGRDVSSGSGRPGQSASPNSKTQRGNKDSQFSVFNFFRKKNT